MEKELLGVFFLVEEKENGFNNVRKQKLCFRGLGSGLLCVLYEYHRHSLSNPAVGMSWTGRVGRFA